MRRRATRAVLWLPVTAAFVPGACSANDRREPWQTVPLTFDTYVHDIQFLDPANGWIVGGGHFVEGGLIARTTDGGTTWIVRTNVVPRGKWATHYHLRSIHFVDAERGWITGDAGRILRTDDGGESWTPQRVPSSTQVLDVFFIDRERGWAVTWSETILLTTDGGDTWSRVEPQPGVGDCAAIRFLDRQNGVAVGGHGIAYSVDGGHRWQQAEVPDVDYWSVDFPSAAAGWAVGARGTILRTTDGGRSWQAQASGVSGDLRGVRFVDDRRGWVIGAARSDGSVILHTEDAGATWIQQQQVPGLTLETVTAIDASHAWAAGRRPSVEGPQTMVRLAP